MDKNYEYLTTEVSEEDIANAVADEYGVLYSKDGKRLLKCENKNLTEYTVRNGTKVICDSAFRDSTGLTEVTIPNNVTTIGNDAFGGCKGMTSITIGNSLTNIGRCAFYGCTGLTEVTIPNSVTSIGDSAFSGCKGLMQVNFNATACTSASAFYSKSAFCGCDNIVTVIFGDSVTIIPDYLCNELMGLTSITIPNSVTSIGRSAFEDCMGLTEMNIGNSVTSIGYSAFSHCTGLTEITIPNSVTAIDSCAFAWCVGLTEITIPESVTSIDSSAFQCCFRLKVVTIGNSVTEIGFGPFYGCIGLTKFEIAEDNENYCAKDGVLFTKDMTMIIKFPPASSMTSYNIPNSVTRIDYSAFEGCMGLTQVTIPDGVTTIGWGTFSGCMGLMQIAFPESVTKIGAEAFKGCTGLTSITVPNNVTRIGDSAFADCTGLTSIVIPDMVTEIGNCAFQGCSKLNIIRIVCSQDDESIVFDRFSQLLPEKLHDIISIEYGEQLPSNKTNEVTYAEPTESETLVVSETDDAYANDIADKLSADRVDYDIPPETRDEIDWEYPVVKYPQYGCVVFPYRNRSIARMGYMEPLFMDYLLETFDGCGLQIVGDCSILPRDGQRPYEPDIAIIPDEYPSIRIDVEIDEPYAAVTNKPIHYIGCGDDFRDMNLNNLGWIVIRFTEYQVYSNMKGCAAFIAQVLHDIQPRISLPAYLLSYPLPETEERWQEIEAKVLATEKYREKYLKHKFTESEKREYTTADVTQTELEKECAELVSPLIVSPSSETTDEAIELGNISTRQEHTDKCQQAQHDAASIGTNHKDAVSAPSAVLPVAIEKRDEHIQFFPFEHIYLYNGCAKLTPVSSVIACFFEQFDAVTQAEAKAYKGMPAGKILEDWDIKGCMAKEAGTFMHKQIENVYNGLEYQKVYHFRYDGKYLHADMEIPLEREYQHFQNFLKDHDFRPHKTEWAIYDENLEIAGTIDMLRKRGDVFDIYDWKRSNKIVDGEGEPVKIGFRGKSGINGLESVQDTAYWHYCIQQNLYRYILEKNYGITVDKMYLVVMIASMDNYIKLEVPRMNDAIEVIVKKCRNGFIKWMNIGLPF